ncbi:MAG: tetratricopeptide repeat protein [Burkholderiales bacterium]
MSLLLEALKKAEKAKEEAQRQAGGAAPSGGGLEMEPVEPARHVTTRDELPDIAQPMEISSDDIRSAPPPAREAPPPERRPPPEPEERPRPARAAAAQPQAQPAERAAAKKVFEAKFKEPNPKLPFYITMGILIACAIGTAIYFYLELRPPPPLVNPNPPKTGAEQPVAVPDAKPAAQAPQAATTAAEIPGLPDAKPAQPAAPTAAATPAPAPSAPPTPAPAAAAPAKPAASPRAAAAPRESRPAPATPPRQPRAPVAVRRAAPAIDPQVSAAYEAYNAGNLAAARSGYERALAADPTNRDALLGLAAVEMRSQNFSAADALYQKLLRADPRDAHAQAGMLALRSQSVDPVAGESRVKSLLANDPESGVLHFTLANQYAQQGRWAEAQQSYFKAHASEPDNPDFAYNLAVSLDRLRQRKLAADYYRRALDLAARRSAAFDPAAARTRLQELSR